jgi:hypothetical protein
MDQIKLIGPVESSRDENLAKVLSKHSRHQAVKYEVDGRIDESQGIKDFSQGFIDFLLKNISIDSNHESENPGRELCDQKENQDDQEHLCRSVTLFHRRVSSTSWFELCVTSRRRLLDRVVLRLVLSAVL